MSDPLRPSSLVSITVDGNVVSVPAGMSLAAALIAVGQRALRRSPRTGLPRGAFCFMGVCQECVVLVDGRVCRACMTEVRAELQVSLRGADRA